MPKNDSPITTTRSAMSRRLMDLAAELHEPKPYPVTETLVIKPLTRTRRQAMHEAEGKLYVCSQLIVQALRLAAEAAPDLPEVPQDASDEQIAEHDAARAAYDVAFAAWEKRHRTAVTRQDTLNEQNNEAQREYERAFFGDAYDEVIAYFEEKPALWSRFLDDIKKEFLPAAPSNGVCPTCGAIDEEQAGKARESST